MNLLKIQLYGLNCIVLYEWTAGNGLVENNSQYLYLGDSIESAPNSLFLFAKCEHRKRANKYAVWATLIHAWSGRDKLGKPVAYLGFHKADGQISLATSYCSHKGEGQAMFFLFLPMVKNKTKLPKG